MKARKAIFVVVLLVLGAAMWAQSYDEESVIYKTSREELMGYLKYLGYVPASVKEKTISMKLNGYSTSITVSESDLYIYAWFSGPADPERVNKFNSEYRFASAYWDEENDICLQSDIDLQGGITLGAIAEWIKTYSTLLDDYNNMD